MQATDLADPTVTDADAARAVRLLSADSAARASIRIDAPGVMLDFDEFCAATDALSEAAR